MWVVLTPRYPRPLFSHTVPAYAPNPSLPAGEKQGNPSSLSNPTNAAHASQVQKPHPQAEEVIKLPPSVDKSEALFTMYLDRADEDDKKITERWKGECDAILIFVSHFYHLSGTLELTLVYRLVFSRLLLLLSLPFPSRAFSRVHRIPRHSILKIFIIYSPIPLAPYPLSFPSRLIHLNFLRQNPQSWLTHCGS